MPSCLLVCSLSHPACWLASLEPSSPPGLEGTCPQGLVGSVQGEADERALSFPALSLPSSLPKLVPQSRQRFGCELHLAKTQTNPGRCQGQGGFEGQGGALGVDHVQGEGFWVPGWGAAHEVPLAQECQRSPPASEGRGWWHLPGCGIQNKNKKQLIEACLYGSRLPVRECSYPVLKLFLLTFRPQNLPSPIRSHHTGLWTTSEC